MKTYFKYILLASAFFIANTNSLFGQVAKTDYFMKTSIMRNYMNPALRPDQGHLIVPAIPTVGASLQTNTLNLDHLTFPLNGERVTFIHPGISADQFLKDMKNDNYINADVNTKLFAFGFFKGDGYWNIDLGVRAHVDANLPKSAFELLKVGFDQNEITGYDLKNLSATGMAFAEIGVGHSRPFLDNNLVLGARVKLLLGAGHFNLNAKTLNIQAGPEEWRTISNVTLKGAAPGVNPKYDEDDFIDGFDFDWKGLPGFGAGFDLGGVYEVKHLFPILRGLKVSAALNDIGFISWNKKNSLNMRSSDTEVVIRPNDYEHANDGSTSLSDVFEDALDDLKKSVNLQEDGPRKGQTTMLRMTLNTGAEYEIVENIFSVGALYSNYFGNNYSSSELTFSGNYRPCSWFATSVSYSTMFSSFDTFGLALHVTPAKGLNLFLASDYVTPHVSPQWVPTTSKGMNVQFGISIPLGAKQSNIRKYRDINL